MNIFALDVIKYCLKSFFFCFAVFLVRKLKGKEKDKTKGKNYSQRKKVLMASFIRIS
jgi:hypothetical protein